MAGRGQRTVAALEAASAGASRAGPASEVCSYQGAEHHVRDEDDHGESHRRGGGIACGPDGHPLEPAQTSAILGADPAPVAATSATERVG